jgi:predicted RND superfamily exporter protein
MGSLQTNVHNKNLLEFTEKHIDSLVLSMSITGAAHLVDRNNEYMVSNMTQGFVFSIIVICLLTFLLHRSWRMVLVFILPNVIPLIIIGGIMGFAGIELKAATSLVFSIAFGIATDDTIHFISRLKIELDYGKSLLYAFKRTYFETGKPIVLTTFILLGGFMSLMTSNFQSTFYFGFLICITVVIAVLADLFLLPVLLFWIYGKKKTNK